MAGHDQNFSWKNLAENYNLTTRRICVLTYLSDLIVEGRTRGGEGEKISKKWLLECRLNVECEHVTRNEIRSWDEHPSRLLSFIIVQMGLYSKELPGKELPVCEDVFNDFIVETRAIRESLTNSHHGIKLKDEDKKQLSELGFSYFYLAIEFVKLYSGYFDYVFKELHPDSKLTDIMADVPKDFHAIFKRYEFFSYLLGYAGIRLVANAHLNAKANGWCCGCFRRTEANKKTCHLHKRINAAKSDYQFADKVRNALIKKDGTLISHWDEVKECIVRNEVLERKYDEPLIKLPLNWKVLLIKRIKGSPVLSKKLDIEKIQSSENWVDAIKYLRDQIDNKYEDSMCIESVWSWLSMAKKWFEGENYLRSPAGDKVKSSKNDPTGLPTVRLIIDLCEKTPGITVPEIAKELNRTTQLINRNVKKYKLEKYLPD